MKEHGFFRLDDEERGGLEGSGVLVGTGINALSFIDGIRDAYRQTRVRDGSSSHKKMKLQDGLLRARQMFRKAHDRGCRVIFIGNGGSAAIASHMAVDYTKNGGIRSMAFNDAPTLTCLANDYGYFQVFAKQLEYYASEHDVVVLISSSGKSKNILEAAAQAMNMDMDIVTFSGMDKDNPLTGMGDLNFFVPAADYGLIEITHLSLLHTITSVPQL